MTTIDRIKNKILKETTIGKNPRDFIALIDILEAELTAVKGVDELEAQLNQAQNNAEIWTAIWAIYDYLKQTTVASEECCCDEEGMCKMHGDRLKDSQPKEVLLLEDAPYKEDLGCRIYGYVNDGKVNITRVEYTGTRGIG